ncbi:MAG: type II toxin-antitoxin system VapC family toxin [Chloroflexota bacterium]
MRSRRERIDTPLAALIDTGAFFALTDQGDTHHRDASAILEDLARGGTRLFTTNLVLAETHALLVARLRRADTAFQFLTDIYGSDSASIIRVTERDEQRALEILARSRDKLYSFTDVTSFVVMERLGITRAFSFDRNFAQYGFTLLTAD